MKKLNYFLLALVFIFAFTGCSSSQPSSSTQPESGGSSVNQAEKPKEEESKPIKAKLAHNMPVEHHISKGAEKFAELMKERTNGQVEITVYPSGQLYDDHSGIDAVTNGSVELVTNTLSPWGSIMPTAEIFSLPGIFTDPKKTYEVIDNGLGEMIAEDMRAVGAESLFLADYGFSFLSSITDQPFLGKDSFAGKKIRVTNISAAKFVEQMGGSPISMSGSEVPQALARGTIDGAFSGATSFDSRKYDDFSKNFTGPFYVAPYAFAANKKWYDSLPEDVKKVMKEVSAEVNEFIRQEREKEEAAAIENLTSRGMPYIEPSAEVRAEWLKASEAVVDEWLQRAGDRGKEEIDFVYEHLK